MIILFNIYINCKIFSFFFQKTIINMNININVNYYSKFIIYRLFIFFLINNFKPKYSKYLKFSIFVS